MKKILFCIYHKRDHDFFLNLAKNISSEKFEFYLLYFIEFPKKNNQFKKIFFYDNLNIESQKKFVPKSYLFHEKIWSFKNEKNLNKKYSDYKLSFQNILKKNNIDLVIQELGGFVCHLSMYEATGTLNIKHIFIEPSFIKGHCYFLLNTLKIEDGVDANTIKRSKKLLSDYYKILNKKKYFAINNKDTHLKKANMLKLIFSKYTIAAFFSKIKQLILNQKSEFRNLHIHLIDFVDRTINYAINIFFSLKNLNTINNFIYFPLHVPRDLALTLRAPECLDQIYSLKSVVTEGQTEIIFKEHPLIFSRYNYFKIVKQFTNAGFLDNNLPSNKIIKKSKFVITINSKAGLESLALGKPVLTLKKNYYCGKGLATYCYSKKIFRNFNKNIKNYIPKEIRVKKLLLGLTKKCLYFDLYNSEKKSLNKSLKSLETILKKNL
jgi:hypothetical protein